MQYTNSNPARGEERYWSFIGVEDAFDRVILLLKVKVDNIRWDYDNEYDTYECEVLDVVIDNRNDSTKGNTVIVDQPWQLQKTLKQAQSLLIDVIFGKGVNAFFDRKAPF